jgi:SPP1 family predicted phage head-tail adaptor
MQAGLLRQRITIETATETADSFNAPVRTWTALASNVPAAIDTPRGDLRFVAQQFAGEAFHMVTIRYLPGVKPSSRVRLEDGRVFLVQFVRDVEERHRTLELLTKEVVGEVPA